MFDTAKKKHAVAVADVGREGEIRYLGETHRSSTDDDARLFRKGGGQASQLCCRSPWASMKSFRPKDGSGEPPAQGRNGGRDFKGEKRSNVRSNEQLVIFVP